MWLGWLAPDLPCGERLVTHVLRRKSSSRRTTRPISMKTICNSSKLPIQFHHSCPFDLILARTEHISVANCRAQRTNDVCGHCQLWIKFSLDRAQTKQNSFQSNGQFTSRIITFNNKFNCPPDENDFRQWFPKCNHDVNRYIELYFWITEEFGIFKKTYTTL